MADENFTTEELESEEWRDIVGYEGLYRVSNLGRILGLRTNTILKHCVNKRTHYHSVIVAAAFLGPRPKGLTVNHKDGDKSRNRSENLEYATYQANVQHAFDTGLAAKGRDHYAVRYPEKLARGERHGCAVLTEQNVRDIRKLFADGASYKQLSSHFGVSDVSIGRIIRRKNWAHN